METKFLNSATYPIFNVLKLTLVIVPIVAGLDKFTNILTQWDQYLSPGMVEIMKTP